MIVKVELFGNAQVDYEVTCEVVGSKGTLRLGNGSGALVGPTDRRCRHGLTALEQFMARGSLRYREPGPPSQQLTPKASRASPDPQREAGEESSLAMWVLTDPDSVVDLLEPLAVLRTQAPD